MMIITSASQIGTIEVATSNDGRIIFAPIGNDRLLIDGRDVDAGYGCYLNERHQISDEIVDLTLLAEARGLIKEVRDYNDAIRDGLRERENASLDRLDSHLASDLRKVRGGYIDTWTF